MGDVRVGDQGGTGLGPAGHDIDNPGGKPRLDRPFGQQKRRDRCKLRGLHHDGVPRGQRGSQFLGQDQDRVVPRRQQRADPVRAVPGVGQEAPLHPVRPAFQPKRDTGEILEPFRDAAHLRAHFADWTAGYGRLKHRQFRHPVAHDGRQRPQKAAALVGIERGPVGECRGCRPRRRRQRRPVSPRRRSSPRHRWRGGERRGGPRPGPAASARRSEGESPAPDRDRGPGGRYRPGQASDDRCPRGDPAIDGEDRPRGIARAVRGQERHQVGDLAHLGRAA